MNVGQIRVKMVEHASINLDPINVSAVDIQGTTVKVKTYQTYVVNQVNAVISEPPSSFLWPDEDKEMAFFIT